MGRIARIAAMSTGLMALAAPAWSAGFYLQEQGVRATGRAYSGEVADTGVESLWWNPAAIAGGRREAYLGAHAILVSGEVADRGSSVTFPGGAVRPAGGEPFAFNPIRNGAAPNLAVAGPVTERLALGLSLNAPYNFETVYRPSAWARYDALRSRLTTGDLQAAAALRLTDWLDVGLAADAEYADADLVNAMPNPAPGLPDAEQRLRGHGWNFGWAAGAQARLGAVSLGASYRSAIDHELTGRARVAGLLGPLAAGNGEVAARARFRTPWIATVGARWRVSERLTLDVQAQRFGWSAFDAIRVTGPTGTASLVQGYRDVTSGGVGLDYAVSPRLTLRTGVQYDPTPTPDAGRTARVPDGDRWQVGVGASGRLPEGLTLEAAFAYVAFRASAVRHDTLFYAGTPAATATALSGSVEGSGYVLSAGLTKAF